MVACWVSARDPTLLVKHPLASIPSVLSDSGGSEAPSLAHSTRRAMPCDLRPGVACCFTTRNRASLNMTVKHFRCAAGRLSTRTCGRAASIVSSRGTATAASSSPPARWRSCWRSCRSCCCWPSHSSAPSQSRCAGGVSPAVWLYFGFDYRLTRRAAVIRMLERAWICPRAILCVTCGQSDSLCGFNGRELYHIGSLA